MNSSPENITVSPEPIIDNSPEPSVAVPSTVASPTNTVLSNPAPSASSSSSSQNSSPATSSGHDFIQHLSPSTKGLLVSSKARLLEISSSQAKFAMPSKFKFLKSKLEKKSEDIINALNINAAEQVSSLLFEISDSSSEIAAPQQASIDTDAIFEPKTQPSAAAVVVVKPQLEEPGGPAAGLSAATGQACCDREQLLDDVIEAGVSIFPTATVVEIDEAQ